MDKFQMIKYGACKVLKIFSYFSSFLIFFLFLSFYFVNKLFFKIEVEFKDWLSFYGSVFGSLVTIIGVWLTLQFELKKSREDRLFEINKYSDEKALEFRPILSFSSEEMSSQQCDNKFIPSYFYLATDDFNEGVRQGTQFYKQLNDIGRVLRNDMIPDGPKKQLRIKENELKTKWCEYIPTTSYMSLKIENVGDKSAILKTIRLDNTNEINPKFGTILLHAGKTKSANIELKSLRKEEYLTFNIFISDLLENNYVYPLSVKIMDHSYIGVEYRAKIKVEEDSTIVIPMRVP